MRLCMCQEKYASDDQNIELSRRINAKLATLEKLDVKEIQEIEKFIDFRIGVKKQESELAQQGSQGPKTGTRNI